MYNVLVPIAPERAETSIIIHPLLFSDMPDWNATPWPNHIVFSFLMRSSVLDRLFLDELKFVGSMI